MDTKPCPHCKQLHEHPQDQVHCDCGALLQPTPDGWRIIAWVLKVSKSVNVKRS